MNNALSEAQVLRVLLITFIGYVVFAANTDISSLGLSSARNPERWALWRYLVVGIWLLLAYLVFIAQDKKAFKKSFIYAVIISGIVSLVLASIWLEVSSKIAILGSAIIYAIVAGLLCLTMKNHLLASILAVVLIVVQLVVDIFVLGTAGQFRIH